MWKILGKMQLYFLFLQIHQQCLKACLWYMACLPEDSSFHLHTFHYIHICITGLENEFRKSRLITYLSPDIISVSASVKNGQLAGCRRPCVWWANGWLIKVWYCIKCNEGDRNRTVSSLTVMFSLHQIFNDLDPEAQISSYRPFTGHLNILAW